MNAHAAAENARRAIALYQIATPSDSTPVKLLSGGNIQRLVLARELSGDPRLIVAAHPTYGLDVGATEQVRQLLLKERGRGAAILLTSEDLEEILAVSDRILVMFSGEVMGDSGGRGSRPWRDRASDGRDETERGRGVKGLDSFRVERRPDPSGGVVVLVSLLAIVAALAVAAGLFKAYGVSPVRAYQLIVHGALGTPRLTENGRGAIPLLLCGVGFTIAFRAVFWNIGAEGQLLLGAIAAAGVALFSGLPDSLLIPAMFLAGFLAGAAWGLVPAILKAKLGERRHHHVDDELRGHVPCGVADSRALEGTQMRGFAYTDKFPDAARLPLIPLTRIHWPTLAIGLALALLAYILVTRTRQGFEIRVVGENAEAARFAGISHVKTILLVMLISGGLAGLAGVGEVAGVHGMLRSSAQISMGYGYTAIIVAWLARRNPLAVILTSLLFGVIMAGGDVIKSSLGLPFQLINVFNGLILFFLIGSEMLMRYRVSFSWRRR